MRATPPLFLFPEPIPNSYLPLAADVSKDFGMMAHAIIVEGSDYGAGKVRAIRTASDTGLARWTKSYLTIPAIRCKAAPGKAAITLELLQSYLLARGHVLVDLLQPLLVVITPGTIYGASSTIKSTDSS